MQKLNLVSAPFGVDGLRAALESPRGQSAKLAADWLHNGAIFLDTETTGLGDDDQVIEIGIVSAAGEVLLRTLVRPTVPVDPEAQAVHGITAEDLADAPEWSEIASLVEAVLASRRPMVIFNADFDVRLLRQTAAAHGDVPAWIDEAARTAQCAMIHAARVYGATNRYGTISLAKALVASGAQWQGPAHSAVGDAMSTAELVRAMASVHEQIRSRLVELEP